MNNCAAPPKRDCSGASSLSELPIACMRVFHLFHLLQMEQLKHLKLFHLFHLSIEMEHETRVETERPAGND